MTTRTDITVDFDQSPRIAEVASPSVELTMQDTVDTLRKQEDTLMKGMANPKLVNASGKESLGGGVNVGITVSLQDTQIAFEARTTPAESGTVTTGSGAPVAGTITFIDSAADFVAAGIARGSMVINYTDQSIADVVEVVNLTTLRTKTLVNGIGNTYDSADAYDVFNVIQCDLQGGNLVAVDSADLDISPVLPTAFTQIVRTASSSATLIDGGGSDLLDVSTNLHKTSGTVGAALIMAQYQGAVFIDINNGTAGTTLGLNGTPSDPSDSLSDALTIASELGVRNLVVVDGTLTLTSSLTEFLVQIRADSSVNFGGQSVNGSEFIGGTLTGIMSGTVKTRNSFLEDVTAFLGVAETCGLGGTVTLGVGESTFDRCHSQEPGTGIVTLDFVGAGRSANLRAYSGGIQIENMTNANNTVTTEFVAGRIIVDSGCTAGALEIRGIATVVDNSAGTTVNDVSYDRLTMIDELMNRTVDGKAFSLIMQELLSMANGRIVESPTGTFKMYAQDNTTVLFTLVHTATQRTRS